MQKLLSELILREDWFFPALICESANVWKPLETSERRRKENGTHGQRRQTARYWQLLGHQSPQKLHAKNKKQPQANGCKFLPAIVTGTKGNKSRNITLHSSFLRYFIVPYSALQWGFIVLWCVLKRFVVLMAHATFYCYIAKAQTNEKVLNISVWVYMFVK